MSVVIPCHNYGRFLASAVDSVTHQPGVDVDVLIIDDGSTDGSPAVAQELANGDSRVEVILHEKSVGHIATYNEGIAAAQGDYLVLMSADDMLAPASLARATALLEAHPSVGFAYGGVVAFTGKPPSRTRGAVDGWTIWDGPGWIAYCCRIGRNPIRSPEVVMRLSVQRQIGGYCADLPHTADLEMWLRAAAVADVGRVDGATQAFKRKHANNLSTVLCREPSSELRALYAAFSSVLTGGSSLDGAEQLHRDACKSLAATALRQAFGASLPSGQAFEAGRELEMFALEAFPSSRWSWVWLELKMARTANRSAIGRRVVGNDLIRWVYALNHGRR